MSKKNIILILTDHFRRDAVSQKVTPTLWRLAKKGTIFTNCYTAAPLCQPARASIITGLYPSMHGICGNQAKPISEEMRNETFMNKLQSNGYYTAMIGKHHYIDRAGMGMDVRKDYPEIKKYGFDFVFTVDDDDVNLINEDEYTHYLEKKGLLKEFREQFVNKAWECKPHPFTEEKTPDGFIGKTGVEFINNYEKSQPFYINLSFIGPHPPYWHPGSLTYDLDEMDNPIGINNPEEIFKGEIKYQAKTLSAKENRAHYMEKCSLIDRWIGKIVKSLDNKGLLENTVIIFTSDHGDNLGDHGIWDKRFFYEQSCGIPMIIYNKEKEKENRLGAMHISKALINNTDLYATITDIGGINTSNKGLGISLLPILQGEETKLHSITFSELSTSVMIRTANWKLVFDPEQGGTTHLFNMKTDPKEMNNLTGKAGYESVEAQLIERILSQKIRSTQYSHWKEESRLQKIRVGGDR